MIDTKILQVANVSAGYEDRTILSDVSFSLKPGEMVGIIGANGAGKSTLMRTIRGLQDKLAGEVIIGGKNKESMSDRELAEWIAYLSQQPECPFGYTAREIVMIGRYAHLSWWQQESPEDEKIVSSCMGYTHTKEFADRPMQALSGGQRQRVFLAQILAQQTPILFLDEPATGLDVYYQEEIFRFCKALCKKGKTVLMVVHELGLAARFCSRLLLFGNGGLMADGAPKVVLQDDILTNAYGVPLKAVENPLTGHIEVFSAMDEPEDTEEIDEFLIAGRSDEHE